MKLLDIPVGRKLSKIDRLIYNKLFNLSSKRGYATVSNEYLANTLSISVQDVSKSIKNLRKQNLIKFANLDRDGIKGRKIFINL